MGLLNISVCARLNCFPNIYTLLNVGFNKELNEENGFMSFVLILDSVPSGPTVANVTGPPYSSHNQSVRLSCCTDGAIPGIDVQWDGITCSNKTNAAQCSTCTMTSVKEEEGKIITCTATNTRDRSKRTSATYRIVIARHVTELSKYLKTCLTSHHFLFRNQHL